jgi:hypothetical protein
MANPAVNINHSFVSGKADGADPTLVQPSKWNAAEIFSNAVANKNIPAADSGSATGASWQPSGVVFNVVALTPGVTVALDATLGAYYTLVAGQNFTLSNPTGALHGQRFIVRIKQDGTGSRILTLDTKFRLGTDIPTVVLSTAASKTDYLGFIYDSVDDKFDIVAFTKGF